MATTLRARSSGERRFYTGMALMMAALMFAGFAPSFFLRGLVVSPRPVPTLTLLVVFHGAAFTLWMLVFLMQTTLVAAGRVDLHRQWGRFGFALAVMLVPLMYLVTVGQVARLNQPPFASALAWTAVPLSVIAAFVPALWLGWRTRRDPSAHKRLMLAAALMMMGPSIGRLPLMPPTLAGFAVLNLLSWSTYLPTFWWDRLSLGHVHWATKVGAGLGALALLLPYPLLLSSAWTNVARHLPGV